MRVRLDERRTRVNRRPLTLAAVASSVVLLAMACTSGGGKRSTATTTGTGTKATTTTTVAVPPTVFANDTDKAKAALLTLSDLPQGWTAEGNATTGSSGQDTSYKQVGAHVASCLGVSADAFNATAPEADSPTFDSPAGSDTVDDESQVFPTEVEAKTLVDVVTSSKTPSCLTKVFNGPLKSQIQSQLESGQQLVSESGKTVPITSYGDGAGQLELTAVISQSGIDITAYRDIIVVRKGRSASTITVTQPGSNTLTSLGPQLASVVANRMTP